MRRIALLWIAAMGGLFAQSASGPMVFDDLVALIRTGVDEDLVRDAVRSRGLAFVGTPAVRRALRNHGVAAEFVAELFPPVIAPGREALGELKVSAIPLATWTRAPNEDAPTWTHKSIDAREHARITASTVERPADFDERPVDRTLGDTLNFRLEALTKREAWDRRWTRVAAGLGLTSLVTRIERKGQDELHEVVWMALAALESRRQLLVRLTATVADPGGAFARNLETDFFQFLSTLAPLLADAETIPDEPERARIALLVPAADDAQSLILIDRDGRVVDRLLTGRFIGLAADPLAHHLFLHGQDGEIQFGPLGERRGPAREESLRPHFLRPGMGPLPIPAANSEIPLLADGAGQSIFLARPVAQLEAQDLVRFDLLTGQPADAYIARFRPATRLEAITDPGSDALLALCTGTHWPLPPATAPVTLHRLLYIGPELGTERPVLFRKSAGADAKPWREPRFQPSGFEILVIDDQDRLLVLPRSGGTPLVLHDGPVLAAAPWILPR